MKIRASTLIVGLMNASSGLAESRWQMGSYSFIVHPAGGVGKWSSKSIIFKNAPYTINNPHPGQMEVRIRFGELAAEARGMKGLDPDTGLPHAAAIIKKKLKGYVAPDRMLPTAYPSRLKRSVHTIDELREMLKKTLEAKTRAAIAVTARAPG